MNSLVFSRFNNITFSELTNNNIFLFDTLESLREVYIEFEKLMKDLNYEHIRYATNNEEKDVKIINTVKCRRYTTIYRINDNQRIIFTVEPMSILTMTNYKDLWFINKQDNRWFNFAFTDYANFETYKTNEEIYKFVCQSKYSCGLCK